MARKVAATKSRTGVSIISLKGTAEYQEWLGHISRKTHIAASVIVRLALKDWAAKNKHEAPPEM
jgi:hypothetical protein